MTNKFFKLTQTLPPNESIKTSYKCALDGSVSCSGKVYCGTQSLYIYSKINYKTLIGKSTKIRLYYRDIRSVTRVNNDSLLITLEVMRSIG